MQSLNMKGYFSNVRIDRKNNSIVSELINLFASPSAPFGTAEFVGPLIWGYV